MAFSCKSTCRDRHSTLETRSLLAIFGSSSCLCLLAIFILPFLLSSSESVNASAASISPITGEETEMRQQQQRQQNNDEDEGRAVSTGRKCEIKVHIVSYLRVPTKQIKGQNGSRQNGSLDKIGKNGSQHSSNRQF